MNALLRDLIFGWRVLRTKPGFTAVAVITLALGIGVNTAIFSTVNAFILRPLPIEKPDELFMPFIGQQRELEVWGSFSYPDYVDFREQNHTFASLMARRMMSAAISGNESRSSGDDARAEIVYGELVSGNYFEVLGVKPALGRAFLPEECRTPGTHPVAVISHSLWERRFKADPSLLNQTIYLNARPFTVIGIASERFKGSKFALGMDFWTPLMMQSAFGFGDNWISNRSADGFELFGRLKPGITLAQAEADWNNVAEQLGKIYPATNQGTKIHIVPESIGRFEEASSVFKRGSVLALAVVGLVLLVACANVANLMLARAASRSREIGIRLALGASRFSIVRQLLIESTLLALCGGALGLLLAYWGGDVMRASIPPLPYTMDLDFAPDLRVLKWAFGISLLTGVIFGLVPALQAARTDLIPVLKGETQSMPVKLGRWRRWNLRQALVVAQITISLVVLICSGLFYRSLRNVQAMDPGFKTENLISMTLDPGSIGYKREEGKQFYSTLLPQIEALPGVASASTAHILPLTDVSSSDGPVIVEGQAPPPPNQGVYVGFSAISPKYFETAGVTLLSGRDFTERDRTTREGDETPKVVIVNQEFARRFFGDAISALGQRFRLRALSSPLIEIVGIARDGKYRSLFESQRPYMFLPQLQDHYRSQTMLLVRAKASGEMKSVAESMRQTVQKMDARVPVFDLKTADQHLSWAFWGPRVGAGMASSFALLALALATMGLYSLMTYAVSQRTREIGLRMALGAEARDVLRMVLRQGLTLVAIGLMIGLALALALSRLLGSLLMGIGAGDPVTFIAAVALLAGVALLACYLPARRATKVDPMVALRYE